MLLSIKPAWAEQILSGKKRFEFRKIGPLIDPGSRIILYTVEPESAIVGEFTLGTYLKGDVDFLIRKTRGHVPQSEEDLKKYFGSFSKGVALGIIKPVRHQEKITFEKIKELVPEFFPPQSFLYLDGEKYKPLLNLLPKFEKKQKDLFSF